MKFLAKTTLALLLLASFSTNLEIFAQEELLQSETPGELTIDEKKYNPAQYTALTFLNDQYEITFLGEGKFRVEENATVYFPDPLHGIYIQVPYKYKTKDGLNKNVDISFEKVCYSLHNTSLETCDQYEESNKDNNKVLKIGDPNFYIQGIATFRISYTVQFAVNKFEDHDELYWNVIGTDGNLQTIDTTVIVNPIESTKPDKVTCYTGAIGSKEKNCEVLINDDGSVKAETTQLLQPYEGFTIAVAYPPDSLGEPTAFAKFMNFILPNLGFGFPLITFVLMFIIWSKWGKDAHPTNIIPQYRPTETMTPLLAAGIEKMRIDNKDVTAEIIDLAINGYLKIKKAEDADKYTLINLKESSAEWAGLKDYQIEILKGLFDADGSKKEVAVEELKDKMYKHVEIAKSFALNHLTSKKLFDNAPNTVGCFTGIAFMVGGLGFVLGSGLGISWPIGLVISAAIIIAFGIFMGKRSKTGTSFLGEVLGLKMYVDTAEKHRIEFHNDPAKAIKTFESLLPYAMIFGLEKKWAKEFEDLYTQQPEWYDGGNAHSFTPHLMANSLNNFSNNMNKVGYAAIQQGGSAASGGSGFSSGGGFSGGGFGGGGRGGW